MRARTIGGRVGPRRLIHKCLDLRRRRPNESDDTFFVQRHDDRDRAELKLVDRVLHDGPIELLPLSEQATTIGVLFLNDAQDREATFLPQRFQFGMPDRHVRATARSPGGEVDQQHLLSGEVSQRSELARRNLRQSEIGMRLTDNSTIASRGGMGEEQRYRDNETDERAHVACRILERARLSVGPMLFAGTPTWVLISS